MTALPARHDETDESPTDGDGRKTPGFSIGAHRIAAGRIAPGLHIVATPIGNLRDVTLRALETLAAADLIACEDTRVTRVLLDRYGIRTPLVAYHEHNAARMRPRLLAELAAGRAVALASDAGTPLVSDPGYRLVVEAAELGYPVVPLPGASAVLAALVAAAQPTDAFLFAGFLPVKGGPRKRRLTELGAVPATLVFFESPRRLGDCLADMVATLGAERPAAVARELTKLHETIVRGTLGSLAETFAGDPPRGEIVVVIGPPGADETAPADVDGLLRAALARMPASAAAADVARLTGEDRRTLYRRAMEMKAAAADEDGDSEEVDPTDEV
ncbi:16S rRNA (cytidine(1402)-2'-O)-methyltransferase [Segnochrobactrum spirostomi]|uniref:Ribosomal RNA small subunit methyltransferase I n=1 Tax=Segnochrobactrum spirostomi TaxID=2608987 RepID=A0A6A7Y6C9_9HYPH|nr:16S rRNA (cytidine(1402)-2'-O)-methyltransferase [Segnochrobactrum spirostomi]MQT13222.1 16S rRNA (cytidine(1402)-2'-O)-methyltransferase [Segnochrobactrum spirostomi]